jgi:ketosteroid isomerase-like protein
MAVMTADLNRRGLAGLAFSSLAGAPPVPSADDTRLTLERYARAWAAGDFAAVTALYADDFTLTYLGHNGLAGEHPGKARSLAVLAAFTQRSGRRLKAIDGVMAGPQLGAIAVREAMGADAAEVRRVLVYTVREGLLRTCTVFDQDQALVDRLVGPAPV